MYDRNKRMKKREERLIKKAHLEALEGITKEVEPLNGLVDP